MNQQQPAIMTKPLPMILDELENYIRRVEEAVREARAAAADSRQAADDAKAAGEQAASAARKAAEAAVAQVRDEAARAAEALSDRIYGAFGKAGQPRRQGQTGSYRPGRGLPVTQRQARRAVALFPGLA